MKTADSSYFASSKTPPPKAQTLQVYKNYFWGRYSKCPGLNSEFRWYLPLIIGTEFDSSYSLLDWKILLQDCLTRL